MRFGPTPVDEAEGAILAHSQRAGEAVFKKGRVLSADDLAALRVAGLTHVVTAQLDPGDLDENAAAERLAAVLAGAGLTAGPAATGRVNLFADAAGLPRVDKTAIDAINAVDEALTVATVPDRTRVEAGQIVATVKVITFGLPAETVDRAVAAAGEEALSLDRFVPHKVGLLQTRQAESDSMPKPGVLDKTVTATRARVEALGSTLDDARVVDHDETAIAEALAAMYEAGLDIVLVIGVSAIVDRRDVVPAAVERAGGDVLHLGMPADPGNLTLLACIGETWVLGLPGSARSPRLHGSDWILERLVADLPVTGADMMAMGVGGLLKDVPGRPLPRARAAPRRPDRDNETRVAAVVLAAGQSRRMGGVNKLLAELDGTPLIVRTVDAALASRAAPIIVVTGHERERVRAALSGRGVTFVDNPEYEKGLSTSLDNGLRAVPEDAAGALICLSDMPGVAARHMDALIDAFAPEEGCGIVLPVHEGKRGNPVLWARRYFAELRAVSGDVGGRHLLGEHADDLCEVPLDDAVLLDLDTPDALDAAGARPPDPE